jgi:hypothetical protein
MNPPQNKDTGKSVSASANAQQPAKTEDKKLNLNLKSLKKQLNKALKLLAKHATFAAILLVLVAYLFVVMKISHLATADPPAIDPSQNPKVPKIDKNAIQQIQQLEQSNTEVHSFFDAARNNPFQE